MGFSPTSKRHYEVDEPELNLNPMMDLFGVLIPALLMMSAAVEVSVINVAAPSIGPSTNADQKPPEHPPLNLTVVISETGYSLSLMGQMAADFPVAERPILCSRYRGTRPTPRARNLDRPICQKSEGRMKKQFLTYDNKGLTNKLVEVKDEFPDERRIIIQPGPEVEYETIVDVMDAARDVKTAKGEIRSLFDEVVMSPGPPGG
ncbi:MAG: biopolymer transporter ExbD [Deltaproteobacteria bacterium]|nr:biopolymer transporter ExbD [Deltaproteobacteria bacterium]